MPPPAGGCLLSFVPKMKDVFDHSDDLNLRDFRLLKIGRHFRIGDRTKVIIGRYEADNNLLETARQDGEAALTWMDGNTPVGIITGIQAPTASTWLHESCCATPGPKRVPTAGSASVRTMPKAPSPSTIP